MPRPCAWRAIVLATFCNGRPAPLIASCVSPVYTFSGNYGLAGAILIAVRRGVISVEEEKPAASLRRLHAFTLSLPDRLLSKSSPAQHAASPDVRAVGRPAAAVVGHSHARARRATVGSRRHGAAARLHSPADPPGLRLQPGAASPADRWSATAAGKRSPLSTPTTSRRSPRDLAHFDQAIRPACAAQFPAGQRDWRHDAAGRPMPIGGWRSLWMSNGHMRSLRRPTSCWSKPRAINLPTCCKP